ncbi:MAG TPA: hypothetical protein VFQ40_08530 [Actinomycetota bacterium]|nr:hypothetical protein [Actinomycetota bacterium]
MTMLRDETGLIGKIAIVWILILALLGVGAIDAASIAFTTYRLADVGSTAAGEGARVFERTRNVRDACERVTVIVEREDPTARVVQGGCAVERPTGQVTVEVRKKASTLVAHRIPWTEDFAVVEVTETAGVPSL